MRACRGVVGRGVSEEGAGEEELLDSIVKDVGWGSRTEEIVRV
jgi:hypothetical protein